MNQYKDKDGFFRGKAHPKVAKSNAWVKLEEDERVYVNTENEVIVSDVEIKGALLLSERPSNAHQNIKGEWVELEAKPSINSIEALTLRVEVIERQLVEKSNNGKSK